MTIQDLRCSWVLSLSFIPLIQLPQFYLGGYINTSRSWDIISFNAPNFGSDSPDANDSQYVTNGNNIYTEWMFNVTLGEGQVYTGGQVAFTEFTFLTGAQRIETQAVGSLKVTRNFSVPDGDLTVGTESPTTDPRNLTVYGDIKLPTS